MVLFVLCEEREVVEGANELEVDEVDEAEEVEEEEDEEEVDDEAESRRLQGSVRFVGLLLAVSLFVVVEFDSIITLSCCCCCCWCACEDPPF